MPKRSGKRGRSAGSKQRSSEEDLADSPKRTLNQRPPVDPPRELPAAAPSPEEDPNPRLRLRKEMMRSIVTEPLLSAVQEHPARTFDVIIALNELFTGGLPEALRQVQARAEAWGVRWSSISNYCFARLTGDQILRLADEARELTAVHGKSASVVYRIWEDSEVEATLTRTLTTVKADAAHRAFRALGEGVVWAVLDSGIDRTHEHFSRGTSPVGPIDTLACPAPLVHTDFTPDGDARPGEDSAREDRFGHGTHVAGIIAGCWQSKDQQPAPVVGTEILDEGANRAIPSLDSLALISGVAPLCKVLSLKVIADVSRNDDTFPQREGKGKVSWVLKAIEQIQVWNQHGKRLLIHGVNMSLGYDFDARWFGCGQSPICTEVNRLVKSGVCVVVSAGNSGYPTFINGEGKREARYNGISITDPGNADLAITVGSTHRDMPHMYGVSYFSSRGPTGDGRRKPDLLAPGERIWSCAAGLEKARYSTLAGGGGVLFCEQTGTSMAAPHVSGAAAAFLSVRREFIGQPERVKALMMASAIDLGRERDFQGAGLLDLMKVLQAV